MAEVRGTDTGGGPSREPLIIGGREVTVRLAHDWVCVSMYRLTDDDAELMARAPFIPMGEPDDVKGPTCLRCEADLADAMTSCPGDPREG